MGERTQPVFQRQPGFVSDETGQFAAGFARLFRCAKDVGNLVRPMGNEDAWPALFRRTLGLSPVLCLRELKLASSGAACEGTLPPLGSQ